MIPRLTFTQSSISIQFWKNTVLNFPVVTMNASTWMTWNSPFFLVLWLKVYDIALVNIIISEIEQVVHKMVHAVTAYPSISLKLSVLRVFCTEIEQPVEKV